MIEIGSRNLKNKKFRFGCFLIIAIGIAIGIPKLIIKHIDWVREKKQHKKTTFNLSPIKNQKDASPFPKRLIPVLQSLQ